MLGVPLVTSVVMAYMIRGRGKTMSWTYCWHLMIILSFLWGDVDAKAAAFSLGLGLNVAWYGMQIMSSFWSRVIPYFLETYPGVPRLRVLTIIRLLDIGIHVVPLVPLVRYRLYVGWSHALVAMVLERLYFYLMEGTVFPDGRVLYEHYDLRPRPASDTIQILQVLSILGYAASVIRPSTRVWLPLALVVIAGSMINKNVYSSSLGTSRAWRLSMGALAMYSALTKGPQTSENIIAWPAMPKWFDMDDSDSIKNRFHRIVVPWDSDSPKPCRRLSLSPCWTLGDRPVA